MGHEDDDRHEKESAPHNTGFFKTSSSFEKMSLTGTSGMFPRSVQKNLNVMNQLGCQLTRVGGGRKNIAQYLRTGTERGSNIKPVMAKFS